VFLGSGLWARETDFESDGIHLGTHTFNPNRVQYIIIAFIRFITETFVHFLAVARLEGRRCLMPETCARGHGTMTIA
jgi:hypothetical protein